MKTPASSLSMFADRQRLARIVLGVFIPVAIVALAVGPKWDALGLSRLPAMHLHWPQLGLIGAASPAIKIHLLGVTVALVIGVVLLAGVKGTALHKALGWTWVIAMFAAAVSSLFIRIINHGSLSLIHLLSGWTILVLPMAIVAIRQGHVRMHARFMTGLFTGGLILAGALAFMPGRLMWEMFFR